MSQALSLLKEKLPCRLEQIEQLYNLFAHKDEPYVESIFVYGGPSSGKSIVVTYLLESLGVRHTLVNLTKCYSTRILFETVLNKLVGHRMDAADPAPYAKCDRQMDFISHLREAGASRDLNGSVLVLDKAEELRNMDDDVVRGLLRIRELSGISITLIMISQITFDKYLGKSDDRTPLKIHFPQYNKQQLVEILCLDLDNSKKLLQKHYDSLIEFDVLFYQNYLNLFLSVLYRACRDLSELKRLSKINFIKYYEPVFKQQHAITDSMALWRNIVPELKTSLEVLYLRLDLKDNTQPKQLTNLAHNNAQTLELPFYSKYLLIAAFLASYNSVKDDKRLFMKFHGKKRKTVKGARNKLKVSVQMNIQLGPKPFTFDRLLAIFYAILDEKVSFNNNLLVQVSSLVELNLLSAVWTNSTLDGLKYKSNVSFEFICSISKMVEFNIRKYLSDFIHE